jgi:hypothetical protein
MNRFVALARTGLLGFAAASIVISTGCGMDVGVGGTTGTGGHDSGSGGSCSGPGATTTVGVGGSPGTTGSTGTGSTPVVCGGFTEFPTPPCAADEFCDYGINNCGAFDNQGVCTKRPQACDKNLYPTCGCDGQIHGNECDANAAGTDVNNNGCMPPAGQFSCGAHFCQSNTDYCEHEVSDIGGLPDTYTCKPVPAACGATPSCACLSGVACGTCSASSNGDLTVIVCSVN